MEKTKPTKNKFPEIQFKVDKEIEKAVGAYYISKAFKTKDFWFLNNFIKNYPELTKIKELTEEEAKKFFNDKVNVYYQKEEPRLKELKKEIEKNWNKLKEQFFIESEIIFDNHKWPEGTYNANISLFGMFRLVPGTKNFSIPSEDYSGNTPAQGHINYTIIHEMTHIIFEDFYKNNFKEELSKEKYYVLLDIVNYIVLNLPQINKLTNWVSYPYPNEEQRAKYLDKVYKESKSMKEFVEKAIIYLKDTQDK
jgi:hypothetical protein